MLQVQRSRRILGPLFEMAQPKTPRTLYPWCKGRSSCKMPHGDSFIVLRSSTGFHKSASHTNHIKPLDDLLIFSIKHFHSLNVGRVNFFQFLKFCFPFSDNFHLKKCLLFLIFHHHILRKAVLYLQHIIYKLPQPNIQFPVSWHKTVEHKLNLVKLLATFNKSDLLSVSRCMYFTLPQHIRIAFIIHFLQTLCSNIFLNSLRRLSHSLQLSSETSQNLPLWSIHGNGTFSWNTTENSASLYQSSSSKGTSTFLNNCYCSVVLFILTSVSVCYDYYNGNIIAWGCINMSSLFSLIRRLWSPRWIH